MRALASREWDAVIDASGYVPAVVGNAAQVLSGKAAAHAFMSTVSVYPDRPQGPVSEDSGIYEYASDVTGTAEDEANWSAAQYGSCKAGCERAETGAFGGEVLVLRPGVILGPQENVGRLTWGLARIAAGGHVLAGDSHREIQPVDVRDLAAFTVACLEAGITGTFNVTVPPGHGDPAGPLAVAGATARHWPLPLLPRPGSAPTRCWPTAHALSASGVLLSADRSRLWQCAARRPSQSQAVAALRRPC
jgi:nucleoside-diphosphate-sugar epimerase